MNSGHSANHEAASETITIDIDNGDVPEGAEVAVSADEEAAAGDATTATVEHTADHGGKATMPQLDPTYMHSQIFWLAVTFLALWAILSRTVLPRITTILENRQNKITQDLERAEKLGLEAEAARDHYEKALVESRTKAQALIAESAALMEKTSTARHNELTAKLDKQLTKAEADILSAKEDAMAKLTPIAKELTQEIVEKLTGQKLKAADVSSVVDSIAKEGSRG